MLKSIERLNKEIEILKQNNIDTDELVKISKDIEQEIDKQFVMLPVDCDGVSIHLDDELIVDGYLGTSKVCCMRYRHNSWVIETDRTDSIYHSDFCTRHYY